MPKTDDFLPALICRRNWLLWAGLMIASLLWRSNSVFFGVAAGGLVSISGFYWLRWSLTNLLSPTGQKKSRGYLVSVLLRLLVVAGLLFLMIGPAQISPPALAVGLSVVVLNILGVTLERIIKGRICIS
jgi:hypothetical protein